MNRFSGRRSWKTVYLPLTDILSASMYSFLVILRSLSISLKSKHSNRLLRYFRERNLNGSNSSILREIPEFVFVMLTNQVFPDRH